MNKKIKSFLEGYIKLLELTALNALNNNDYEYYEELKERQNQVKAELYK